MIESIRHSLLALYLREAELLEAATRVFHSAHKHISDGSMVDEPLEEHWAAIQAARLERQTSGVRGACTVAGSVAVMAVALLPTIAAALLATWLARMPGAPELIKNDMPPASLGSLEASVIALVVVTLWLAIGAAMG